MAMSKDDTQRPTSISTPPKDAQSSSATGQERSLFAIPPPLKRIFDKFPLVQYAENAKPIRVRDGRDQNVLYVFATEKDARRGNPSFNPSCLKWQTYIKLTGLEFSTVSSSNHASPSGALPFLLPAGSSSDQGKSPAPVASNRIKMWLSAQKGLEKVGEPENVRYEAYASLMENGIRQAWLFQLYITPMNSAVTHRLYVASTSSNVFVQKTIMYQLRQAAESELLKASISGKISEIDIMREFGEAVDALATLLGQDVWFFAQTKPTLFDASVFAYTHLILDERMEWVKNDMGTMLRQKPNLVQHRNRILELYY